MILNDDTPGKFFRLDNLEISNTLKNKIIDFSKNYAENFRWYGTKRKKLYMYKITTNEIPELDEIYSKFVDQTVVDSFEIMLCEPRCVLVPHTDTDRFAAINIPINGNFEKSCISFFENDGRGKPNTTHEKDSGILAISPGMFFDKNPPLIGNVIYNKPICINVEEVHNATNAGNDNRILLSIGTGSVKFCELEQLHKENNLLT